MRPVVGVGRAEADDIRNVGGRVIGRLEVGSRHECKAKMLTEDECELIGEVGAETLEGNVASEVTVGGST